MTPSHAHPPSDKAFYDVHYAKWFRVEMYNLDRRLKLNIESALYQLTREQLRNFCITVMDDYDIVSLEYAFDLHKLLLALKYPKNHTCYELELILHSFKL